MKTSILYIFFLAPYAFSQELTLPQVWQQIKTQSPALEASKSLSEAANVHSDCTSRHWFPQVYLQGRTYQTNDPGQVFFGLLEQKAISATDFNAAAINSPSTQSQSRLALGVDWPLYEGGMKSALQQSTQSLRDAQRSEYHQNQVDLYTQVAKTYGSIGLARKQKDQLSDLQSVVHRLIKSYQLGSKSNPVGYSGLLGMRSLDQRLTGMIDAQSASENGLRATLKELGLTSPSWVPKFQSVESFVKESYPTQDSESFSIESLSHQSKAAQDLPKIERSRFLPRIGAFAETYQFSGSRDTASGTTAGLYLQWSLFNAQDYGSVKEAQLKAFAAQSGIAAQRQKEQSEKLYLFELEKTLIRNLQLIKDSQTLMSEQVQVTEKLFRNGSVNALQFVEVLNRKADLILAETETHKQLLEVSSLRAQKQQLPILDQEMTVTSGGLNEKQ